MLWIALIAFANGTTSGFSYFMSFTSFPSEICSQLRRRTTWKEEVILLRCAVLLPSCVGSSSSPRRAKFRSQISTAIVRIKGRMGTSLPCLAFCNASMKFVGLTIPSDPLTVR